MADNLNFVFPLEVRNRDKFGIFQYLIEGSDAFKQGQILQAFLQKVLGNHIKLSEFYIRWPSDTVNSKIDMRNMGIQGNNFVVWLEEKQKGGEDDFRPCISLAFLARDDMVKLRKSRDDEAIIRMMKSVLRDPGSLPQSELDELKNKLDILLDNTDMSWIGAAEDEENHLATDCGETLWQRDIIFRVPEADGTSRELCSRDGFNYCLFENILTPGPCSEKDQDVMSRYFPSHRHVLSVANCGQDAGCRNSDVEGDGGTPDVTRDVTQSPTERHIANNGDVETSRHAAELSRHRAFQHATCCVTLTFCHNSFAVTSRSPLAVPARESLRAPFRQTSDRFAISRREARRLESEKTMALCDVSSRAKDTSGVELGGTPRCPYGQEDPDPDSFPSLLDRLTENLDRLLD